MINAIEKFNITAVDVSEDESEATLVVEPLVRGYGITLGNSLRRVLLSTLPGYDALGRLFAIGYLKGILDAVKGEIK